MHPSNQTSLASIFSLIISLVNAGLGTLSSQHPFLSSPTQNDTSFNFDDLSVPKAGLTSLPNPYHHLTFSSSFSVFAPQSPAFSRLIYPADLNCAVSAPNALLGSRVSENGAPASFEIANGEAPTSTHKAVLQPGFTFQKMMVKPLAAPEPGTNLSIKGYREGKGESLEWGVWFPAGFHEMFEVRIEEFSGVKWDGLRKVEVKADFGYDGLDWEFCVDDLVVEFYGD